MKQVLLYLSSSSVHPVSHQLFLPFMLLKQLIPSRRRQMLNRLSEPSHDECVCVSHIHRSAVWWISSH